MARLDFHRNFRAALFAASALCVCAALADDTAGSVSVKRYTLDLTLDPAQGTVAGTVDVDLELLVAGPLRLDMAEALAVRDLSLDGKPAGFTRDKDSLTLSAAAGTHRLSIRYDGKPAPRRLRFDSDAGGLYAGSYGLPYSAMQWWPDFDDPSIKAASADIRITVPESMIAASNGKLVEVTPLPGRLHRYHWTESYPVYADVISVAAAPYVETDRSYTSVTGKKIPLTYFLFKEDQDKGLAEMATVPDALGAYEELFGPYPFQEEKYGVAEMMISSFREHQTLPSLGKSLIEAPAAATEAEDVSTVIAHDLAHQWFGNSLTPAGWSDVWLNESFSNYAVALWHERRRGTADYHKFMDELDTRDFAGSVYAADGHDFKAMFGTTTFNKGAWVLHMLRHVMGDAPFFAALRNYVAANRYGRVDTARWRTACEKQYGKPLDWFFEEWVYGEGRPAFKSTWTQAGGTLSLTITQTQAGQAYTLPLDVELRTPDGASRQTVWLRQSDEKFQLAVKGVVRAVVLDPDGWVLKD